MTIMLVVERWPTKFTAWQPVEQLRRHWKTALAAGAVILLVCAAGTGCRSGPPSKSSQSTTTPTRPTVTPTAPGYGSQTVLPFTGLQHPTQVTVDNGGNVYVTDTKNNRVLKLAPESSAQTVLPFTGLTTPTGLAVDNAGDVYTTDAASEGAGDTRLLKLAAGTTTQTEIFITPDTVAWGPAEVAVDRAGNVYITRTNGWVEKLAAGSMTETRVPFTDNPTSVGVDTSGHVYAAVGNACGLDSHEHLVKVDPGANTQTRLPVTDLSCVYGVAVDDPGNVYVSDTTITVTKSRVLRLAAGTSAPAELPFTGLKNPLGVAVDTSGNVYVVDTDNNRVLKLSAQSVR